MVCSSCGFENATTMRFCGMCGTPLPYRPLTTPESQSTLKYTRLPLEDSGDTREHVGKPVSSSATMVMPERPGGGNGKPLSTATIAATPRNAGDAVQARSTFEPQIRNEAPVHALEDPLAAAPAESEARRTGQRDSSEVVADWSALEDAAPVQYEQSRASEAVQSQPSGAWAESSAGAAESHVSPEQDMVPDVPFDEYLRNFHYQPPSEPTEVTMRCDSSVADDGVSQHSTRDALSATQPEVRSPMSVLSSEDGPQLGSAVSREVEAPAELAATTPVFRDVEDRLGLDAEAAPEVAERPRFLDVHESHEADDRGKSGTSTIVGPSFLGLSDAPQFAETGSYEDDELPHKSHWRGWVAAAVVLIFAGLGYMEWRTQVNQTDNGPVEILKTKIRNWTNGSATPASSEPAAASSTATNAKPEMKVQEPAKPQTPGAAQSSNPPVGAANNPNAAAPAPQANAPAADTSSAQMGAGGSQEPSQSVKSAEQSSSKAAPAGGQPTSPARAAAEKGKSSRPGESSADQQSAVKASPGADELKKAANASDSAASAAWLWKSTAKGNPDAPVQLADMYIKGDGVPRSCEQAVVLLKTAAEKENARARNRLASMYASGNCVQRNRVEAYRWLSSALTANPHSDWAQQNKELIWQQMTPDERVMAAKYR